MKGSFHTWLKRLRSIPMARDPESLALKLKLLKALRSGVKPRGTSLVRYQDALLFICAYPENQTIHQAALNALASLARELKTSGSAGHTLVNSGLPYTLTKGKFSHTLVSWLLERNDVKLEIDSMTQSPEVLAELLQITLPNTEKHLIQSAESIPELLENLGIAEERTLRFIVTQTATIRHPGISDLWFEKLELILRLIPRYGTLSKALNSYGTEAPFFHDALLKRFDHETLLDTPVPDPVNLTAKRVRELVQVIRDDLVLLQRETDPATYLDARSLRLYPLERGISVALYTMTPDHQLPLESYVGYTLFKNGYPLAYGGAWVFGRYALFGINVHDSYRGGESGIVLCQLLRLYRQIFGVTYFEVEPYQYGKDNPEGIASGAYWFYYRYGFRSAEPSLRKLADRELTKRSRDPGYRTPHDILYRFTGSNCVLQLGQNTPPTVYDFTDRITQMINARFKGDRKAAAEHCVGRFMKISGIRSSVKKSSPDILTDYSLLHYALGIRSPKKTHLIAQMILAKSGNPYRYQDLLLEFLNV